MTEDGVVYYRSGIGRAGVASRAEPIRMVSDALSHAIGGSCDTESGITELN